MDTFAHTFIDGRTDLLSFDIVGTIEDQPVFADFDGEQVRCAPLLWERASIVVAMGDTFVRPDGSALVASLERPDFSMLLTLVWACSEITSIRITPQSLVDHGGMAWMGQSPWRFHELRP